MTADRPPGDVCWHVTSSVNRASIERHGIDWERMGAARGIAGSRAPELPAVFLTHSWHEALFFAEVIAETPVDVWKVDARGLLLEDGPNGWLIHRRPIARERLQLVRRDLSPPPMDIATADGENQLRIEIQRAERPPGDQPSAPA